VASSLKTVSARAILTAMINGETDPLRLADLAKGKMRRKIPDLAQALTGHFDTNYVRAGPLDVASAGPGRSGYGGAGRGHHRSLSAMGASDRAAANHSRRGEKVAQVFIAETGGDIARFPTAAHLAAWAGLAPAMDESAGKQSPAGNDTATNG
jgi:transposase